MRCSEFDRKYLASAAIFLLLGAGRLAADGGFFAFREFEEWRAIREMKQEAFINYDGGFESMLLAIRLDTFHNARGAWIFPIPSAAEQASISFVPDIPAYWGVDVKRTARSALTRMFSVLTMSQLYPIPFLFSSTRRALELEREDLANVRYGAAPPAGLSGDYDVEIYGHIDTLGLTTELISVRDRNAPFDYLQSKGLVLPARAREILRDYASKNYAFVVSWVSDTTRFSEEDDYWDHGGRQLAVCVRFPTDRIFFPLVLSQIYRDQLIPIEIAVEGYVRPRLFGTLKRITETSFRYRREMAIPEGQRQFFGGRDHVRDFRYTILSMKVMPRFLTDDLWIESSPPFGASLADWIQGHAVLLGALIFIVASLVAGLVAAISSFRGDRYATSRFVWLWPLNVLTLAGVIAASVMVRTHRMPEAVAAQSLPGTQPRWDLRKALYLFLFAAIFMALVLVSVLGLRALI